MKAERGKAGDFGAVTELNSVGPMALVSQPLYVKRHYQPELNLKRWQVPCLDPDDVEEGSRFYDVPRTAIEVPVSGDDAEKWRGRAFLDLLSQEKCFTIGGVRMIPEFGLLPAWYNKKSRRQETLKLIKQRGWLEFLKTIRGKENDALDPSGFSLMGPRDVDKYLKALPPPIGRKPKSSKKKKTQKAEEPLSAYERRDRLTLRLRKATEIMVMTESVLTHRFGTKPPQLRDRFAAISGKDEADAYPEFVYDHLWLEPVIYVVSPRPRPVDVAKIVTEERSSGKFHRATGQDARILYRILFGAPCTWSTCVAAAEACNRLYGTTGDGSNGEYRGEPTLAVTIHPDEFKERKKIVNQTNFSRDGQSIPEDAQDYYEDLLLAGSIAPPPSAA